MMDMMQLRALFQKVKTLRIIQLVMSIAAVLLAALASTRLIGFALGAVTVVVHLSYGRRVSKQYTQLVQDMNLCMGLGAGMDDPQATGSGNLTEAVFDSWQMLPHRSGKGESILSRNGFSFGFRGKRVHGSEITFHYHTEGSGDKYRFISGTALWCEGGEGDWLLLRRQWLEPKAEREFLEGCGYHPARMAENLREHYMLLSHEADAVLDPELEKQLEALLQEVKNLACLRLSKEHNALLLLNRFYTPKVAANSMPTQRELVHNTFSERDMLLELLCPKN